MDINRNVKWEIDGKYDVALLFAPYLYPPQPSIALSLFKSVLTDAGISSKVIYPMFYMSHILGGDNALALSKYPELTGVSEFIFSDLTDVGMEYSVDDFIEGMTSGENEKYDFYPDKLRETIMIGKEAAKICVEETARKIIDMNVRVLAASSIFAQQNASFAILKRVKEQNPLIKTIMGGTNLRDRAGIAVLRNYDSVDYVFFGEGDEVFDEVCIKLIEGDEKNMPFGVIGRKDALPEKAPYRMTKDMNKVKYPDYTDFVEEYERERGGYYGESILTGPSIGNPLVEPDYVIYAEGSRGCWWGEKHTCTFCGLNGEVNVYRAKTPERLHEEIKYFANKYPGHCIQLTDNILSLDVMHELLPVLAEEKEDYRLFGEVKTNITENDIINLVRAGFKKVQPGIEQLNDHLIQLMGKGNTAVNHVAFLKYSTAHGLPLAWNILIAIPGEAVEDYDELMDLMPKLFHLQAPLGPFDILFQRYSKYVDDPEAYGLELVPFRSYKYHYGNDPDRTDNMLLYYMLVGGSFLETKRANNPIYDKVREMVEKWQAIQSNPNFHGLTMSDVGDEIFIMDERPCMVEPFVVLDKAASDIYRKCWSPMSEKKLFETFAGYGEDIVRESVTAMIEKNIMIRLSGKYLALAIPK